MKRARNFGRLVAGEFSQTLEKLRRAVAEADDVAWALGLALEVPGLVDERVLACLVQAAPAVIANLRTIEELGEAARAARISWEYALARLPVEEAAKICDMDMDEEGSVLAFVPFEPGC